MALLIKGVQKYQPDAATKENADEPIAQTLQPIVTGSSVIGLSFKGGVMLATDTLCSYGSFAKFRDMQRIEQINTNVAIVSSGEYSDFQEVVRLLKEMTKEEFLNDDKIKFSPRDYGNYLARLQYQRRNKFNPYLIVNIIAGYQEDKPYLAYVDHLGTYLEDRFFTTGYASYVSKPIIANYWKPDCSEQDAKQIMEQCFRNLFYRDSRATDKIQIAVIDNQGVRISDPYIIETKWDYQGFKDRANEKIHTE